MTWVVVPVVVPSWSMKTTPSVVLLVVGSKSSAVSRISRTDWKEAPNADGYILVKNTGENLLSVTKLRTTNGKEQASITTANVDDLLAYANTFDTLEEITYSTQPGEVEIENPEVNELGDGSIVRDWLEKIFKGIRDLLRP